MTEQYTHTYVDFGKVSPQSSFLESYPQPPDATSTLYLNTHTTTNPDSSKNYQLVGVKIVLSNGNPNGLWESFHVDRKSCSIDPQNPKVATKSLEIYCDTLEVHGQLSVPEADVSIFARRIIWATPDAAINTSPLSWSVPNAQNSDGTSAAQDGVHGRNAGNFRVFVSEVIDSFTVGVTIYSDPDYKGQSKVLSVGIYDISELGIGNDTLSSLRVPKGLQVTLYEHSGFQGRFKVFTEDASSFGDDFNDITSSIKIEPLPLKRFIANGGNGQAAGEGTDGKEGKSVESKSYETFTHKDAWVKQTTDPPVYFNPPAVYYEYGWFVNWNGWIPNNSNNPISGTWGKKDFPTDGTPAIAPGKPGNAGDAGKLKTNSHLVESLSERLGGRGGDQAKDSQGGKAGKPEKSSCYKVYCHFYPAALKSVKVGYHLDTIETREAKSFPSIKAQPADKAKGKEDKLEISKASNAWLHPLSLQKAIEYARDLFLSNSRKEVQDFLAPYDKALSLAIPTQPKAWEDSTPCKDSTPWKDSTQWLSAHSEIATMLLRLSSHLDYFGNPGGFSPFLSFTSTIKLYENETKRALKALLLSHWISEKAQISEEKSKALQESISVLNEDTQDAAKQIEQTEEKIESTINEINSLSKQLENKADKLDALRAKLLEQANDDVALQHQIKFGIKLCAAICQVIPVGQPVLGSVATLASVASNLIGSDDSKKPDTVSKIKEAFGKCQEAYNQYKGISQEAKKQDTGVPAGNSVNNSTSGSNNAPVGNNPSSGNNNAPAEDKGVKEAKAKQSAWATVGKGIGPALSQVSEAFSALKVPQIEVDAELNRLITKSHEWAEIVQQIQDLNTLKSMHVADLKKSLQVLGDNYARITFNASATVNMRQQVAEKNLLLDLEAVSFVDQMGQRAKLRLIYYLYLMVKAYEASVLMPITINVDWKLSKIAQKIGDFVKDGSPLVETSLNNWVQSLEQILQSNLYEVRDELLKKYSVNQKINTLIISFSSEQTPDILRQLNDTGNAEFNPLKYGLVFPSQEQGRISKIELSAIKFDDTNYPQLPNDYNIEISIIPAKTGILRKAQKLYSIYSDNPLSWIFTYSNGNIYPSKPSSSSEDVLNWIIGNNEIKQKVTLPPIWSDLKIHIEYDPKYPETKPHITELFFVFQVDSVPSQENQRVLNVQQIGSCSSEIIECSPDDLANRSSGFDQMIRIYQKGTTVRLSVPFQTEDSYFKQWNLVGQKSQIKQEESFDFVINDNTIAQCYWSKEPIALKFMVLEESATMPDLSKTENLPLYLTASTEATILGIVLNPDDTEVYEEGEEGWQQVNYKGIVGWIKR